MKSVKFIFGLCVDYLYCNNKEENILTEKTMSLEEVTELAQAALVGAGASIENAKSVARSTYLAERDGIRSHGLLYVPIYAEHVACGKVNGLSKPVVESKHSGVVSVDAQSGFAHPAIDAGWDMFVQSAKDNGVATLTVNNSYNCGVLGHHAERIAEEGLLGLCFTHAPASIAPFGGKKPLIGTNPFSLAVPNGDGKVSILIDQSASVIAKSEIMLRAREGESIEPDWALDEHGRPTTDPNLALKGTMMPSGGYKGFGVGLLVEIMAACLSGSVLSKDASPFSGTAGGPPNTGQCFIAFDPEAFSGSAFYEKVEHLCDRISEEEGARIPGAKGQLNRLKTMNEGVVVDGGLLYRINQYVNSEQNS